ncbi:MAG TPA: hypothetical protein VF633_04975 [Brevundimonas sp.]
MATAEDDGLDQIRRDLIELVLREAGGRVAADPKSPVAQLLAGIVRREMAGAVEELRHGGAVVDTEALAEAIARRMGSAPRGQDFRSTSTASGANRTREIIVGCVAAVVAVAIFVGGFALGGGLTKVQPAPIAAQTEAPVDPALVAPATSDGTVPTATPPVSGDGATGMANQLSERP